MFWFALALVLVPDYFLLLLLLLFSFFRFLGVCSVRPWSHRETRVGPLRPCLRCVKAAASRLSPSSHCHPPSQRETLWAAAEGVGTRHRHHRLRD